MLRILAAFIFFTRLPFWKLHKVPAEYFKKVVNYWSFTGWLTASISAGVLWTTAQLFPLSIAILFAIGSRVLVTGALHEDGLADFFDGFGGGTSKEHTLAIMKDSHIGTYGVIGLIFYFTLLYSFISVLPLNVACIALLTADPWSKFCASQIINRLPYARKEEESKAKVVYERMSLPAFIFSLTASLLPVALLLPMNYWWVCLFPLVTFWLLSSLIKKRLQGYTGDCCGAIFLLCELSFYLGILVNYQLTSH